jgi:hypothetical protein
VIPRRSVASYRPLAGRRPARSCAAPCADHGVLARSAAPWHSVIRREAQILEGNHRSNLVASYVVRPHVHEYLYLPSTTMLMLLLPPPATASRSAPCVHYPVDVTPVHAESTAIGHQASRHQGLNHLDGLFSSSDLDNDHFSVHLVFLHRPIVFNSWSLYFIFAALYIVSHPPGSSGHEWQPADQPPGARGQCPPSATSSRGWQAPSAVSGQRPGPDDACRPMRPCLSPSGFMLFFSCLCFFPKVYSTNNLMLNRYPWETLP